MPNKILTVCADTTHKLAIRTTAFCGLLSKIRRLGSLLSRSGLVDCISVINYIIQTNNYIKVDLAHKC